MSASKTKPPKKPNVSFPNDDRCWTEVLDVLPPSQAQSPQADDATADAVNPQVSPPAVLAPIEFLAHHEGTLPYHFSYLKQPSDFDFVIVHKGQIDELNPTFLQEVLDSYQTIMANSVFVAYARVEQSDTNVKRLHANVKVKALKPSQNAKIETIALVSANQFGNLGDDAITWSAHDMLQQVFPKAQINIYSPPVQKQKIFESDLLVLGGGGLFYDGCIFNAMNYTRYITWAKEAGIPSCGLGIGTQGIRTTVGLQLYKDVLDFCDFVSVRDERDFEVLKHDVGVTTPIHLTQDMAFSLSRRAKSKTLKKTEGKQAMLFSLLDSNFMLAARRMEQYRGTAQTILRDWQDRFDIWCMVQSEDDVKMYREHIPRNRLVRAPFTDIGRAFSSYEQADFVLTSRFHGFILSLLTNTPVVSTGSRGGKIHRLISHSLPSLKRSFIPIRDFTEDKAEQLIAELQEHPDRFTIDEQQLRECIGNSQMNKGLLEYYYSSRR